MKAKKTISAIVPCYNELPNIIPMYNRLKNTLSNFNPKLTEWKNMQLNGYDRIWDCGNLKYEWNKNI